MTDKEDEILKAVLDDLGIDFEQLDDDIPTKVESIPPAVPVRRIRLDERPAGAVCVRNPNHNGRKWQEVNPEILRRFGRETFGPIFTCSQTCFDMFLDGLKGIK
jgi:hypothetical protein